MKLLATLLLASIPIAQAPVAAPAAQAEPANSEGDRPWNVLVMVVDDLGWADIGVHGQEYVATPEIDSIAEDGVRFTRTYAPASLSAPSRLGILTGRQPQRSGVEYDAKVVDPIQGITAEEETLAETLRAAGYRTGFVGKWGLGMHADHHPDTHGFESFYGFLRDWRRYSKFNPLQNTFDPSWALTRGRTPVESEEFEHLEDELSEETVRKIAEWKDEPFFLVHSFNAARGPLQFRLDYGRELRDTYRGLLSMRRTQMLAILASLDEAVGEILVALEENGVADRTIVIFTADSGGRMTKGEPADNGALRGWSGELTEGGLRVPLFIRWPGTFEPSATYDGLVSLLDVVPTVRAALGVDSEPANALDGVDLAPFVAGTVKGQPHDELYFRQGLKRGALVTSSGTKLLVEKGMASAALFDLLADPSEGTALDDPERLELLLNRWQAWSQSVATPRWKRQKREAEEEGEVVDEPADETEGTGRTGDSDQ